MANSRQKCCDLENRVREQETKLEMSAEASNATIVSQQESLLAASSSDKVAASRAMKQNLELKKQVEELESAVIQAVGV